MKAAVLYNKGEMPKYVDFPEPTVQSDEEILVSVVAVALKHFDKGQAKGTHYSTSGDQREAKVIGGDGVCLLPDGTRVYALGVSGMLAEKATVGKDRMVVLPAGLDDHHRCGPSKCRYWGRHGPSVPGQDRTRRYRTYQWCYGASLAEWRSSSLNITVPKW